jgi:hypothetical protein
MDIIVRRNLYLLKRLTEQERKKAMCYSGIYPPGVRQPLNYREHKRLMDLPCMVCRFRWMQHRGLLCPSVPGHWDEILQVPVPPVMGYTKFEPDEKWLDQNPDFAVV